MHGFDHERMDVYRRALEFVRVAASFRQKLVPGHAALADQLDRAAVSIALNIAREPENSREKRRSASTVSHDDRRPSRRLFSTSRGPWRLQTDGRSARERSCCWTSLVA